MKTINFSPKIDEISENIIYLLSLDSRTTITDLAKLLKENRRIVENRVNKLYKQQYIKPLLIYNYKDCIKVTILVKLSSFDKKVIEDIVKLSKITKVKETQGEYDLSLLVVTDNNKEVEQIITKINTAFHNIILKLDVIYHDLEDTLGYKSFCHNPDFFKKYSLLKPNNTLLNKEEKEILGIIKDEPHISYRNLMKKNGWGYNKVSKVLESLRERGVIRFSVDPHYSNLGLEFHNILVKVNPARKEEFERFIICHPRVHWVKRGTGIWNYILSITARDIQEFIDITRDIRTENKENILDVSTLVSKIHVRRKF